MCGFKFPMGVASFLFCVLVLLFLGGCKQEDVAPKMEKAKAGADWDAPPQEEPEPPPLDDGAGDRQAQEGATSDASAGGELPPPPEGESIPMGAPPLPEGTKGIKLSGKVIYDGYEKGIIQIDVSDKGVEKGHKGVQPKILQLYRMDKPGPFEMEIPATDGEVWLSAYNDADLNGRPSREEPRGFATDNPYKAGGDGITNVEIELVKERIPPPPGQ